MCRDTTLREFAARPIAPRLTAAPAACDEGKYDGLLPGMAVLCILPHRVYTNR